jgi:hypothetical protein
MLGFKPRVNIYRVYDQIFRRTAFRRRRMRHFVDTLQPGAHTRILDVGGDYRTWGHPDAPTSRVTLANLLHYGPPASRVFADGCLLPFPDHAFDVVFSNSVIEHLGTHDAQQRFAAETRRVGRALWIQTPAKEFPIEPHWLGVGIHWLPRELRHWARWASGHGLLGRPSRATVDAMVAELRLLSRREFSALYPDCEIWTERWCGLPKSYVAIRH